MAATRGTIISAWDPKAAYNPHLIACAAPAPYLLGEHKLLGLFLHLNFYPEAHSLPFHLVFLHPHFYSLHHLEDGH